MIAAQIIAAKRDGRSLTDDEIAFFVQGYADESIPDYQMSALAMAIFLNGMDERETASLTAQMLNSGTQLNWPDDGVLRVDKHSTGGVGDKVSLPLAPLLACCGFQVPMLSGRGLGPTGGTLDKLESIPGFRTDLSLSEITTLTQQVGCVITGASAELAPADRRLYALRDVTATVQSIPLITASIMSKKLAESLDALVLDVKFGSGAFMKTRERATMLAESLVATGERMGVKTTALLTDMNQPLGRMCGNAVEVLESIDVLKGEGPPDVRELTIELAAELLLTTQAKSTMQAARELATSALDSGAAFEKFEQMVAAQGGQPSAALKVADAAEVSAQQAGFVSAIDTEQLGMAVIAMGGGRQKVSDTIDHAVGLEMLVRIGDEVQPGQPLVRLFCPRPAAHADNIRKAISIGEEAYRPDLIAERITA
ncbi:thymidine phosphorylase [Fuerstiella marisgermanici]|uniref:thymidine phosphorylase n=1 Tax=Fuerstiella marisgermanici TaxID=1891926 RepID=A0A1P8WJJ1_9PLAN|nr:thymidine phosphorylase [Fuerstiella marisgermanici]APZ94225.1 Pyrimidine-nucleoside phosphorylase [Fuerstiella marisgermanici]